MKRKIAIGVMAIWLTGGVCVATAATEELTFDQRVFYQERVERVYYNRRTGQKPPFEQALPHEVMERKVRKYLAQSVVADGITDDGLQRELERICATTRAPDTLRELFTALDNNAYLVKEILVRPILAEKMTRELYLDDFAFQSEPREKAERVLAEALLSGGRQLAVTARAHGAEYSKFGMRNAEHGTWNASVEPHAAIIDVDAETLANRYNELAGAGNAPKLRVTEDAYIIERLAETRDSELTIESLTVRKRPYEEWLGAIDDGQLTINNSEEIVNHQSSIVNQGIRFEPLPVITAAETCSDNSWQATLVDAPGARRHHAAVWTGTEMIVWGGLSATHVNTGSRYNPATNHWTPTSTASAPSGRYHHTAVWTGTEMIVWGGYNDGIGYLDTGGRYNPATNTWTATSITGVPQSRYLHTAVWTGTEMIIWGGYDGYAPYADTGGRYNPATNSWTATETTGAPTGRYYHTAVWTGTEMIVWGGYNGTAPFENTGGRYNPSTNTWTAATATAGAPSARYVHTAVWTGTEMIVWGGFEGGPLTNAGGRYNPSSDSWSATSLTDAPTARYAHTAVWTGAEMIVWGGYDGIGPYANTGGRYNPSSNSWITTTTANAPTGREHTVSVWTGTEMIIWGGYNAGGNLNTGGRYNPATDSWKATSIGTAPGPRDNHAAVWTGAEMIVWGGYYGSAINTGGRYNPATNSWLATTAVAAPSARQAFPAVWTGTEMIVWGGYDEVTPYTNTGGRYNPVSDSWMAISTVGSPTGRSSHTAVWTGTEMIVWGGYDGADSNTGGRYNPFSDIWAGIGSVGVPPARFGHRAVWTGTEMIVWGGYAAGNPVGTGGRYIPASFVWGPVTTTNAPSARFNHTMVWTGSDVLIWGGHNISNPTNDGRLYNPETDTMSEISMTGAPLARFSHTAIWTGTEMIVWGGRDSSNLDLNTGRRYNPVANSWATMTTVNAPSHRHRHIAVWTGTEMVVWGGLGGTYLNTGGVYTPECPCTDDYEPNNDIASAYPIAASTLYDAKICHATDYDYYAMTLAEGGTLDAVMEPPVGLNYDLFLYNGSGNLLAASTTNGDATEFITASLAAGTYYLLVRGHDGTQWSETQFYTLYYFFDPDVVPPCVAPDELIYIYMATLDVNSNLVLHYMDPNQPSDVTGYNVYRSGASTGPWTLIGSNVVDMDAGTANKQFVDTSGTDCGGTCYYEIAAYNSVCDAEGPWNCGDSCP